MDTHDVRSVEEDAIAQRLLATMRGDSGAAGKLLQLGEPALKAMLQTRSRGPYPADLHVIDAAQRLSSVLYQIVHNDPTPLFQLARSAGSELPDAECSDLMRILQEVGPDHEDTAVDVALCLLGHDNPYVRYHCVRVLLKFPRERSRDALLGRLHDCSLMVRRRVIHGMTANGFFRTPETLSELGGLLQRGTPPQRSSLLWAEMKTLQRLIQTERPTALS